MEQSIRQYWTASCKVLQAEENRYDSYFCSYFIVEIEEKRENKGKKKRICLSFTVNISAIDLVILYSWQVKFTLVIIPLNAGK